jgi:hypothetical protein
MGNSVGCAPAPQLRLEFQKTQLKRPILPN